MSYGVKFIGEYKDRNGNHYRANILQKGAANTAFPYTFDFALAGSSFIGNPFRLRYRPQEGAQVVGSELSFSFVTKDKIQYADLLESNYKDFKVEYFINGVLHWGGWLVCDNISTQYFGSYFTFNLSFNDGLAELDRHTVTGDNGTQIKGKNSLLYYIKNSLKFIDLNKDFNVVLNTKETNLMPLATDQALALCELDANRFLEIKKGKKEISSAKEVLNDILSAFDAVLFQSEGKYWIVNQSEAESTVYAYDWATLTQQSTAVNNNTVDITAYKFEKSNELTKKRPLRLAALTFENKNVPSNLITVNPDFSTTDLSFWNRIAAGSNSGQMSITENELQVSGTDSATPGDASGTQIFTDAVSIEQKSTDDVIIVEFDNYLKNITYADANSTDAPQLEVILIYENDTTKNQSTKISLNSGKATFSRKFSNKGMGTYVLKFIDGPGNNAKYTLIEYRIDNVSIVAQAGEGSQELTYDKFYNAYNLGTTAIEKDEETIARVGDGGQINDIGNLTVAGSLTSQWHTFGKTENLNLQFIQLINKLRQNQRFRNKLRLTAIEQVAPVIWYSSQILFDTKRYTIKDLSISFDPGYTRYEMGLLELPTEEITYETGYIALTSVNGKETFR